MKTGEPTATSAPATPLPPPPPSPPPSLDQALAALNLLVVPSPPATIENVNAGSLEWWLNHEKQQESTRRAQQDSNSRAELARTQAIAEIPFCVVLRREFQAIYWAARACRWSAPVFRAKLKAVVVFRLRLRQIRASRGDGGVACQAIFSVKHFRRLAAWRGSSNSNTKLSTNNTISVCGGSKRGIHSDSSNNTSDAAAEAKAAAGGNHRCGPPSRWAPRRSEGGSGTTSAFTVGVRRRERDREESEKTI